MTKAKFSATASSQEVSPNKRETDGQPKLSKSQPKR